MKYLVRLTKIIPFRFKDPEFRAVKLGRCLRWVGSGILSVSVFSQCWLTASWAEVSQRWGKLWERCGNPNSVPKFTQRRERLCSALCLPALVHFFYFPKTSVFRKKKNDNLRFMKAGERWLSIFFNIFFYLSNLTAWPNALTCRGSSCPSFQQEGSNNSPLMARSKKLCQPFGALPHASPASCFP